ncbi:MAG: hypothetical protein ACPGQI_00930 [Gammaproteobacteria bacterium]
MVSKVLINRLFDYGLGELYILHATSAGAMIGQLVQEKGRLILKDRAMLGGVSATQVRPCFDIGIVGAVCQRGGHEWESLTFVGPEQLKLEIDLSSTRVGLMRAATNSFSERLIDFCGSVYRGYQLMMDNHLLPVVLLKEVSLLDGTPALAVSNLRIAGIPFNVLARLHSHLQALMERNLTLEVEDVDMDESDFETLFAQFTKD